MYSASILLQPHWIFITIPIHLQNFLTGVFILFFILYFILDAIAQYLQ